MRYLLILLSLTFAFSGSTQVFRRSKTKTHMVTVTLDKNEYSEAYIIDVTKKKVKPDVRKNYLWNQGNQINVTFGGFDGKLLHGTYATFYKTNVLKSKGLVVYGLRDGTWIDWYENGRIKQVSNWSKGVMSGEFVIYDETGKMLIKANYKHGKLHGKYRTFSTDGSYKEVLYKKGNPIPIKEHHKIRIFTHKDKTAPPTTEQKNERKKISLFRKKDDSVQNTNSNPKEKNDKDASKVKKKKVTGNNDNKTK